MYPQLNTDLSIVEFLRWTWRCDQWLWWIPSYVVGIGSLFQVSSVRNVGYFRGRFYSNNSGPRYTKNRGKSGRHWVTMPCTQSALTMEKFTVTVGFTCDFWIGDRMKKKESQVVMRTGLTWHYGGKQNNQFSTRALFFCLLRRRLMRTNMRTHVLTACCFAWCMYYVWI